MVYCIICLVLFEAYMGGEAREVLEDGKHCTYNQLCRLPRKHSGFSLQSKEYKNSDKRERKK